VLLLLLLLPLTHARPSFAQEYDTPPGRSYRYYTGKPLYSFGDGLSLTTFSHKCTCAAMACSCTVKNTGKRTVRRSAMAPA